MPIRPPSVDELYQTGRSALTTLGFNHWEEGSGIAAIVRVMAGYLADQWSVIADLEQQTNPADAKGIYLDRFGEQFGVPRIPPQVATTVGRGPAVQFTNNGSTAYTIPAHTRVWSAADPDLAFFTLQPLTLSAGAVGYADVIAGSTGEGHNIGVNVLNSHNAGMGQVSVTNIRPVGGGSFFESDDAYRFRISQALQARHGATATAIRQELLKVPGVRDALVHPGVRGNGSLDVLVIPIDRYASNELLANCEQAVATTVAAGISWRVMPPKTRRIDLRIQLRLLGGTSLDDTKALVEAAVRGYVDNLRVNDGNGGSDLIYNELISRVQDASADILDSAVDLSVDGIPSLQTNVTTNPGERLVSGSVSIT
jgi:uncharacterized phage protein gp47/JayE